MVAQFRMKMGVRSFEPRRYEYKAVLAWLHSKFAWRGMWCFSNRWLCCYCVLLSLFALTKRKPSVRVDIIFKIQLSLNSTPRPPNKKNRIMICSFSKQCKTKTVPIYISIYLSNIRLGGAVRFRLDLRVLPNLLAFGRATGEPLPRPAEGLLSEGRVENGRERGSRDRYPRGATGNPKGPVWPARHQL